MADRNLKIAMICGSLRKQSYNRKLMEVMIEKKPNHWQMKEIEIDTIPFFNQDVEAEGDPESVQQLKEAIDEADGVIVVSPEYNSGSPAVLKNALDWASRPAKGTVLKHKPFALAGASPGGAGTVQSQGQTRQTLLTLDAYIMPGPKIMVGSVHNKLSEDQSEIADEATIKRVEKFLGAFEEWMLHFK
ncbi:NADPH-dependent FMN reductase [Geomicrobium sediminis]|uniref:Chromate reductase n=1 Tax=Geomicrobium sediminis TaxID=1347788 RepID=A0ABS2PCD7_9BACL|nr:NADPH-dependent FMN reductase [Geomicrobium sediminis]MBM7633068.1 chromate reductase [Geomicrobium sediminis]